MTVRDVRTMTDAEVFAVLCALPTPFRFEVGRIALNEPDPDLLNTLPELTPFRDEQLARKAQEEAIHASRRPRVFWTVMITSEPPHGSGAAFYGRAPTSVGAYHDVHRQIAAFTEALLPPSQP
jgi:hypothetical protein